MSSSSSSGAFSAIEKPLEANSLATPRPMPRLDPVTSATFLPFMKLPHFSVALEQ